MYDHVWLELKILKEVILTYFTAPFWHSPGCTEGNHEINLPGVLNSKFPPNGCSISVILSLNHL
jgi:hypothetical protein